MKQPRKLKGVFEIVLVIGIILLIPLFFAINSLARPQVAEATATQMQVTTTPMGMKVLSGASPTPTAAPVTAKGKQPPACSFPLAQITTVESKPENYSFSEPQVVLTVERGNNFDIVNWLPDNQQVLMMQNLYNTRETESDKYLRQSIELYNPDTGESKVYAIRHSNAAPPSWQPGLNAVVYTDLNFTGVDENTHQLKFTRQLWASYGNLNTTQMLADNLTQFSLVVKPDSSAMVYVSDNKISKLNASLQGSTSAPFDPTQWDYGKGLRNKLPVSYETAWQPDSALIFLYNDGSIDEMGGYTFILDANTGRVCELNLGGWAMRARWSSDGRYLAIIRAVEYSFPIHTSDLAVLDTTTGNLITMNVIPQSGEQFLDDFVWTPDNRHLLVLGSVPLSQNTTQDDTIHHALYYIDFVSGKSEQIFPEYKSFFADGAPMNNFAWSPDGSKLLIRCPTNIVDRICIISVQKSGQ